MHPNKQLIFLPCISFLTNRSRKLRPSEQMMEQEQLSNPNALYHLSLLHAKKNQNNQNNL